MSGRSYTSECGDEPIGPSEPNESLLLSLLPPSRQTPHAGASHCVLQGHRRRDEMAKGSDRVWKQPGQSITLITNPITRTNTHVVFRCMIGLYPGILFAITPHFLDSFVSNPSHLHDRGEDTHLSRLVITLCTCQTAWTCSRSRTPGGPCAPSSCPSGTACIRRGTRGTSRPGPCRSCASLQAGRKISTRRRRFLSLGCLDRA